MQLNRLKSYSDWLKHRCRRWIAQRRPQPRQQETLANASFGLLSGLVVAGISVGFSVIGAWNVLEQQSYNLLHKTHRALAGAPAWDERVVVIAIDETSVERFGRFPWSRDRYAELLDRLWSVQPAAIAFDILLPEATDRDEQLAEAIIDNANVVLAVVTDSQDKYIDVTPTIARTADGFFLRGDVGNSPDVDGISRKIQLYGNQTTPSLALATLQVYAETMASTTQAQSAPSSSPNSASDRPARPASANAISVTANRRPGDVLLQPFLPPSDNIWVNWPGEISIHRNEPGDLHIYSYADVIDGRVDASLFQNKIVLVGSALAGTDPLRTPFHQAPPTSGIYLYAAALDNLLNRSFLRRPPIWQSTLLLVITAIAISLLFYRQRADRRLAIVLGFPALWYALAYSCFTLGWWLPVAAPIGTVILSALAIQLNEQQEKQQLMALFSMNVSPGTAELIWRHKGEILHQGELAAQKLTATVLFMDIRGFTGIAESLPSQQLLPWLNQYFQTMTDCIMEHGGMVDKYIGDAIMAVFGAPLPRNAPAEIQADAIAALKASIDMRSRLGALNRQLITQGLPTIRVGIGIHTGPLVGGTVGNRHRLNYSLFGDTVNVAARLEAMTKSLPTTAPFKLLLSADTCRYTQNQFPARLFQSVQLRGRAGQTDAYTLVSDESGTDVASADVAPNISTDISTDEASAFNDVPADSNQPASSSIQQVS